jgi:SNF2 family DNA or RNA helicase
MEKVVPIVAFLKRHKPEQIEHVLNEAEQDMSVLRKTDFVSSTKIDRLLEILKDINENHQGEKVIVFSQFVSFLDMLESPIKVSTGLFIV